ncbi:hypothetical protein [Pedobacter frigiditerrae]|uniref:hypothetical protein n=1 Tax=Pedobacter frigiditerrae TaxID=2530452 RepID=UPI002931CCE6|nr:hypothetical protein [Pedobacter frigiditerrae]
MIQDIIALYKNHPTIMDINQELDLMKILQQLQPKQIITDKNDFFFLLNQLDTSHIGGGIFEVKSDNYIHFKEFSIWLRSLKTHLIAEQEILESYAQDLEAVFKIN